MGDNVQKDVKRVKAIGLSIRASGAGLTQNERAWTNPGPLAGHRRTEVGVPDARTITLQNGIC